MTTQTPEQEREDPTAAWRGVKQDIDEERAAGVGLRGPSRRLLVELLRLDSFAAIVKQLQSNTPPRRSH